ARRASHASWFRLRPPRARVRDQRRLDAGGGGRRRARGAAAVGTAHRGARRGCDGWRCVGRNPQHQHRLPRAFHGQPVQPRVPLLPGSGRRVTYRPAPRVEERSSAEIASEIRGRLTASLNWSPPDPTVEALIQVFVRYWEIISGRLNQALDKNFLAYLNYLGVSPIAPTSAVVPLTFTMVEQAPANVLVSARTPVAASAPDGGEPVVFETLRSLTMSGARVRHIIGLDPTTNTS